MRAAYYPPVDGYSKVVMVTHVDEIMWGSKPGCAYMVAAGLLDNYKLKNTETLSLRFCGR